ncbi:hypothetical protein EC973_007303 [Apophysomyces ossiformis]|uniref:NmrA-like domain-containing protein n=1 Tax=Apophysomyces ossiformis TaxID=679940 RepID=A0A8H7EPX0_9FUNG|nr:hypothetical protein EC973_007303 [Apophysomyces ossiformis]
MAPQTERVYIIGGTGNIGTKVVQDLTANRIPTTVYARNPSKAASLFPDSGDLVDVVQGDYSDLTPLKNSLPGHTRLFLLVNDLPNVVKHKSAIAKLAYEAGVKQIVDVSTCLAGPGWRPTYIGEAHGLAEKSIKEIPGRGAFVALRPGTFMSNLIHFEPRPENVIRDVRESNEPQSWVSPNDIAALAAIVLREDIEKHGDAVYELIGQIVTPAERAAILTRILGRPITYEKIPVVAKYNVLLQVGYAHLPSYDLAALPETNQVTVGLPILLGREPETLEAYLTSKKDALL